VLGSCRSRAIGIGRLALGVCGELFVFVKMGPSAARVHADRMSLISAATAPLAGAERVAALDIGWVGAATSADVIDLAGVTDPEIAALPGGHTSKAVSGALLERRRADRIVVRVHPSQLLTVEKKLLRDPYVERNYRKIWISPEGLPVHYAVLALEPPGAAP
jgi:hypothetical protein